MKKVDSEKILLKRQEEKDIVTTMVKLYCTKKHNSKRLCPECEELLNYALTRIDKCPMMEEKTFCSACKIHCYQQEYRARIKKVMASMGPWMLLYHPIQAVKHLLTDLGWRK